MRKLLSIRFSIFFEKWLNAVCSYPKIIFCFFVSLSFFLGWYTLNNLKLDTDTQNMISDTLVWRQDYIRYKKLFSHSHQTIVIVIEGNNFEATKIASKELYNTLRQDPQFVSVYSYALNDFLEKNHLLYLSLEELTALKKEAPFLSSLLSFSRNDLNSFINFLQFFTISSKSVQNILPFLDEFQKTLHATRTDSPHMASFAQYLQGTDDKSFLEIIEVKPVLSFDTLFPGEVVVNTIQRNFEKLKLRENYQVTLKMTGEVPLAYEELKSVSFGTGWATLLSVLLVILLLWWSFRSFRFVLMALLTLGIGLILTAAFATYFVGHLNMISIAFALLFIGLSNDYSIHILLRLRESMRTQATSVAIFESFQAVAPSLLLCVISTTIGFFAFLPTAFHGISELGLIAGTGILISFVLHFTFLPALLTIFPPKKSQATRAYAWSKITDIPFIYRKTILLTFFALCIGSLFLIKDLKFNADPMQLRDQKQPSVITFFELDKKLERSLLSITYLANSLQELMDKKEEISKLPSVKEVVMIHNFIPQNQKDKLTEIETIRRIFQNTKTVPKTQETFELRQSSLEALINNLAPYTQYTVVNNFRTEAQDFINRTAKLPKFQQVDTWNTLSFNLLRGLEYHGMQMQQGLQAKSFDIANLPNSLLSRWKQKDTYRLEIFPHASMLSLDNQQEFVDEVLSIVPNATGLPVIHAKAGETVVHAFLEAFLTAFTMILLLLILLMRNFKQIILTFIPLLAACLFTIAIAVIFKIGFNFANVIALPLLLGIGIDNGIHLVHRYYNDSEPKSRLLGSSTAKAVVVSTLTTIFCFINLAFSPHYGMASLGIILTVGMIAASLSTLLFLPALLKTWNGK